MTNGNFVFSKLMSFNAGSRYQNIYWIYSTLNHNKIYSLNIKSSQNANSYTTLTSRANNPRFLNF